MLVDAFKKSQSQGLVKAALLHSLPVCRSLEQCAEGVAEGVPADVFVDAVRFRNRPNMAFQEVARPIRLLRTSERLYETCLVT